MIRRVARYSSPSVFKPFPKIPGFIASALVPPRATLKGAAAVQQMADDFRQAAYREGGITRDGLSLLGWTSIQIDTLAAKAREVAQRDAVVSL